MWIMWVGSMLATLSSVVAQLVVSYASINDKVTAALLVLLTIGFAGYQANIYQFCIDQFPDASTNAIKSFISWFIWTYSVGGIAGHCIYECIDKQYYVAGQCFISICLSVALIMSFLLNGIFIKEPVVQNPYKLVYKVIKYALQNKQPQRRSAFTFREDELPSRMDFGKRTYGGPFTTEQVEDVKTLFRVVLVFAVGCAFFGMTTEDRSIPNNLRNMFIHALSHTPEYVFNNFYSITGLLLIPLYEVVVHPLFHSCLPILQSHVKFFIAFLLRIVRYAIMLALMTYARQHYTHITPSSNATLSCVFYQPHDSLNFLSETLDYRWLIILEALMATSRLLVLIGALEFYCAQVPYSMKGLVAGIFYALLGFFIMLSQGLLLPFKTTSLKWGTGTLSCGFWYLLTLLIYLLIMMAASVVVMRWYKKRKREDVLPNEQIFAERYYSKYVI